MSKASPYPPGLLARVGVPHKDQISGVLYPRAMGYLIVTLYFHKMPLEGADVTFYKSNDGDKGDQIGDPVTTKKDGIARVEMLLPAVEYVCAVDDQPLAVVYTVDDVEDSFPLVLPIGRPYIDADEDHEFDPDYDDYVDDDDDKNSADA